VKLASQPLVPTCPPFSCPEKSSSSLFISPLFSQPYELLFPQALCFDNHLNCPGVWGISALYLATRHSPLATSPFIFSSLQPLRRSCLSFSISRPLFSATSSLFLQNTGGGGTLLFSLRTSASGACPDPVGAPLRYPYPWTFQSNPLDFPIDRSFTPPISFDFQLSTVDFPSTMLKSTRTAYDHS
jgi:hypothetical protein